MTTARLDGRQRSKRAVLARLASELAFPPHFRPNLDALFDVLTTDLKGPVTIDWRLTENARRALGADYEAIARTLAEAAAARDDLTLRLTTP
ncbi:MAG: barstar family protein [Geminicoccaceae bacterium]